MVTSRKRSVTSVGSGWPEGEVCWSKSREEPGAHKQRHPVKQRQISNLSGKQGRHNFSSGALAPLFFWQNQFSTLLETRGHEGTDDPKLASLAFGNGCKPNDPPLIFDFFD
jgi:hypothetical protein